MTAPTLHQALADADLAAMRQRLAERIGSEAAASLDYILVLVAKYVATAGWTGSAGVGPEQCLDDVEQLYHDLAASEREPV